MSTAIIRRVIIRTAVDADAPGIDLVYVVAARQAYAQLMPPERLDLIDGWHRPVRPHAVIVAVTDEVVGFICVGEGEEPELGYVYDLFVQPDWHGRAVGADLLAAGHAALTAMGITERRLWVLDGNARAFAFYTRHGWEPDGERVMSSRGVERVRMRYAG
jgi:ribosomal protein S18 acetylase RimI-like enzyme